MIKGHTNQSDFTNVGTRLSEKNSSVLPRKIQGKFHENIKRAFAIASRASLLN